VRYYREERSSVRMDVTVNADSPEAARQRVLDWGEGRIELTPEEEETEQSGKEEVLGGDFTCLEEADNPYAVEEIVPEVEQLILRSSYADIHVNRETGNIIKIDYAAMGGKDEWDDVVRFDPDTFPKSRGIGDADVLRVGFWTKDGKHITPIPEEQLRG
jgi:hypothetical protein